MYRLAVLCALTVVSLAGAQPRPVPDRVDRPRPGADQLERLARRLEREAHDLREEVLVHFSGKPGFRDMVDHMREIEKQANRLTRLTDRDARPRMVRESLDRIDEEVRQLERHMRELSRVSGLDRRAYDHLRDEFNDLNRLLYRMRREP